MMQYTAMQDTDILYGEEGTDLIYGGDGDDIIDGSST